MGAKLKSRLKFISIIAATVSITLAISEILKIGTVILPAWFLVLLYFPFLLVASYLLAKIIKWAINGTLDTMTYALSFASVLSIWFYVSQYHPTYTIIVPKDFKGTVHLFVSKTNTNELNLNGLGIGYVKDELYRKGFKPRVLQNDLDISDKITDLATGSIISADIHGRSLGPFRFLSFKTPGAVNDTMHLGPQELINIHALDTLKTSKN